MLEAILWLFLIEVIGLGAVPLCFSVFRFLPERGLTLAKPLGLLLTAWAVWLLSMLGLPFSSTVCWVVFAGLFAALSGWLLWRRRAELGSEIVGFVARHVWLIVVSEIVFIAAYFYLVNVRSFTPEIRDQEKFGDFALMHSMAVFDKMPPADPWLSGYPINYYYFSHFMMAMLTKMIGIDPAISFNLAVPLVFGLTALVSFGIVYNLVAATRKSNRTVGLALVFGLLAVALICFMGNLDTVRQIFFPRPEFYETGIGGNFAFSWWTPSRVIYDYMPDVQIGGFRWAETINEFPMFSFLLADMHPHVMTLPTALLSVAMALNIFRVPAGSDALNLRRVDGWLLFLPTALIVGGLYFLNTWDYPTYLLLIVGAFFLRQRGLPRLPQINWWRPLLYGLGWSGALVAFSLALYLPFHLNFVSLIGDNAVPASLANVPVLGSLGRIISFVAWDRTPLLGYLLVFGLFVLPLLTFLFIKLWPYLTNPYGYLDEPSNENEGESVTPCGPIFGNWGYGLAGAGLALLLLSELGFFLLKLDAVLTVMLGLISIPPVTIGLALLAVDGLARYRAERSRPKLLGATGALALLMIAGGWYLHFEMYGPLLIVGVGFGLLLWFETKRSAVTRRVESIEETTEITPDLETSAANETSTVEFPASVGPSDRFAMLLAFLPVVITFGTELILVRDIYNSRFNTLFKFYYQAWLLFALAGAYAAWRVIAWLWKLAPFEGEEGEKAGLEKSAGLNPRPATGPRLTPARVPQASLRLGLAGGGALSGPGLSFRAASPAPTFSPPVPEAQELGSNEEVEELDDREAEAAEEYQAGRPQRPWWRWLWVLALGLILSLGMIYPMFGPYERTGHFAKRVGLDGSAWLRDGSSSGQGLPQDYAAIQWLKSRLAADKNFGGPILEAAQWGDWVDYSRVSTFTGMPTLIGWWGHEIQWRAGKANARSDVFDCGQTLAKYAIRPAIAGPSLQRDEPACRVQLVNLLYETQDVQLTKNLVRETGLKYVYVGSLETGLSNGRGETKHYTPEALAKFGQFMRVIYQKDGVTIYAV